MGSEARDGVKLAVRMMQNPDEVYRDIARVPEIHRIDVNRRPIPEGQICKVSTGGNSIRLSLRGNVLDSNPAIQIDERTRKRLHLINVRCANFDFEQVHWPGRFLWMWHASDPAYRMAARFAVISLLLSFFGVVLGFLSIFFAIHSN